MRTAARIAAASCAVAATLWGTASHAATPPVSPAQTVASALCPEKAPPGGEYVRTVYQWPPYDVYRVKQPDGTYETVKVYC